MKTTFVQLILLCLSLSACQSMRAREHESPERSGTAVSDEAKAVETKSESKSDAKSESSPVASQVGGSAGLLLAVTMTGDLTTVPPGGCRLKLENVRTNKTVYVPLRKDSEVVFKELEPGRYFGTRLSCATTKIWNLENLFGLGFDIQPGKASYVGKVVFEFKNGDLAVFRHAPRLESQKVLNTAQAAVPAELRDSLISGFTQKPIGAAVMESEGPESFDVYAKGTDSPDVALADLLGRLRHCATLDAKEDPLRLGHFTYVAKYKGKAFSAMKESRGAHVLSDHFVACVENSLRAFQPPTAGELEARVRF